MEVNAQTLATNQRKCLYVGFFKLYFGTVGGRGDMLSTFIYVNEWSHKKLLNVEFSILGKQKSHF